MNLLQLLNLWNIMLNWFVKKKKSENFFRKKYLKM